MLTKNLVGVFLAVFAGGLAYYFITVRKIKRDGLDAEAVVSRYTVSTDSDGDDTYTWYAEYRTLEGETVEGTVANPKKGIEVGRRMRIKYLPEKKNYLVFVEYL